MSTVVILGGVLGLVAVPIALAIGTATYTREATRIQMHDAGRTELVTTVVSDPVYVSSDRHYVSQVHSALAPVGNIAVRGESARVWLAADGAATDPPVTADTALLRGIGDGWALLRRSGCQCGSVWRCAGVGSSATMPRGGEHYWSLVWLGY